MQRSALSPHGLPPLQPASATFFVGIFTFIYLFIAGEDRPPASLWRERMHEPVHLNMILANSFCASCVVFKGIWVSIGQPFPWPQHNAILSHTTSHLRHTPPGPDLTWLAPNNDQNKCTVLPQGPVVIILYFHYMLLNFYHCHHTPPLALHCKDTTLTLLPTSRPSPIFTKGLVSIPSCIIMPPSVSLHH